MSEGNEKWEAIALGDLSNVVTKGSSPRWQGFEYVEEGITFVRSQNIGWGKLRLDDVAHLPAEFNLKEKKSIIKDGDLLLNLVGASIGRACIATPELEGANVNQAVAVIRIDHAKLDSKFALNYLLSPTGQRKIHGTKVDVARANFSLADARALKIPLPPLPEQRRIVARIEELFSRLDAGVAALRHAKAQLQRDRQTVLAAAVTGQLTQAWREQHPGAEPADRLLEWILKEKKKQWTGKRKYQPPPGPNVDELPELPPTWTWATVAQQADPDERAITDGPFGSKLKSSHYTEFGPRVIRLQNIGDGVFRDEYAHIPEEHFETLRNHEVFAGDLVIRALGIPAHQACIVPPSVGSAIVKADCIRFKVFEPHIHPRFTLFALNSHPIRSKSERHIHGVGRPRLNGTEIKGIALPLPPLAEQHQIVAEVEARTTAIDHLEAELDRQITRAARLRQSTLAAAFAGKFP